jgi:hypothetical protein
MRAAQRKALERTSRTRASVIRDIDRRTKLVREWHASGLLPDCIPADLYKDIDKSYELLSQLKRQASKPKRLRKRLRKHRKDE